MGMYTSYEMHVVNGDSELIEQFRGVCVSAFYALDASGESSQDQEWYRHDDDLKRFSVKYPSVVFLLSGKGEEPGDIWREYYKNGQMQLCKAKITFDDYDEEKLK